MEPDFLDFSGTTISSKTTKYALFLTKKPSDKNLQNDSLVFFMKHSIETKI